MIRNEAEYLAAVNRLTAQEARIRDERAALAAKGFRPEEVDRATEPMLSFHDQLREEVGFHERLRRGDFEELQNFRGVGRLLIALRIYQGLSQRELAEKLGVHESQVSRDERNEYHGVTVERAERILEALNAELRTSVVVPAPTPSGTARRSSPVTTGS